MSIILCSQSFNLCKPHCISHRLVVSSGWGDTLYVTSSLMCLIHGPQSETSPTTFSHHYCWWPWAVTFVLSRHLKVILLFLVLHLFCSIPSSLVVVQGLICPVACEILVLWPGIQPALDHQGSSSKFYSLEIKWTWAFAFHSQKMSCVIVVNKD